MTETWQTLRRGDVVRIVAPISETEKGLLGRRFTFDRYAKPHGYAVVHDGWGGWWVHPECLAKENES